MDVSQIALNQWEKKLVEEQGYFDVEQWKDPDNEDKPIRIYYKPSNMRNRIAITNLATKKNKKGEPTIFELAVSTIINRALTKDGKRMFSDDHFEIMLTKNDADVLWLIYYEITKIRPLTEEIETAKKP